MEIPSWFQYTFWSVAVIVSLFLGFFCFAIHKVDKSHLKLSAKAQQVWLNIVGALTGWVALWFLVHQRWGIWIVPTDPTAPIQMTVSDVALAVIAFIGITGYLPFTIIGAIHTFVALVHKVVARIADWLSAKPA